MSISTYTQNLIEYYESKKSNDAKQKDQIQQTKVGYTIKQADGTPDIKVWGVVEILNNFDAPIKCIDNKIIQINDSIKELQNAVLSVGQTANSVGCGTIGINSITVYEDRLRYRGWGLNGTNPFNPESGPLNISNAGIGTENYINPVAIGTYYGPVSICTDPLQIICNATICSGYATSISNLNSTITTKQSQRDSLIQKVNTLKDKRSQFELQKWGYDQTLDKLDNEISQSEDILDFLSTTDEDCL
jgi:hypothetical protein